jgi:hypothetical protein
MHNASVTVHRHGHEYEVEFSECCDATGARTLLVYVSRTTQVLEQSLITESYNHGFSPTPQKVRGHDGLYVETHENLFLFWQQGGATYYVGTHNVLTHTLSRASLLAMASSSRPV